MSNNSVTLSTTVTLSCENYEKILACARDLELPVDSVIRAVVNTSVRRNFEACAVDLAQEEENGNA